MCSENVEIRVVDLSDKRQVEEIRSFCARVGLGFDEGIEFTVALYCGQDIIGTGSFAGNVLRNIATEEKARGEGHTAKIVTKLLEEQGLRHRFHNFLYTRPEKVPIFKSMGFKEIARAEPYAAVLEMGVGSVEKYCERMRKQLAWLPEGVRAGVVVNCNPFTLGHQALIRRAAEENGAVVVFVVSEDRSLFPFDVRLQLIREGVKNMNNVAVIPGEDYIISAATFPAYFTRGEEAIRAQTRLDATLFASRIAPELGIKRRYVGEEPYCPVTRAYNEALAEILPRFSLELIEVPRLMVDGEVVSASKVRDMIRGEDWSKLKNFIPESTLAFLVSDSARDVISRIKASVSRH